MTAPEHVSDPQPIFGLIKIAYENYRLHARVRIEATLVHTPYDWITVAIFAGLIVLFLHRSSLPDPVDHIWQYLLPSVGCAVGNYLGNEELHILAITAILATLGYIQFALRPFSSGGPS
jgi:hypothetical protein